MSDMRLNGITINPRDIINVYPANKSVVLRNPVKYSRLAINQLHVNKHSVLVIVPDKKASQAIKFQFLNYLSKLPNPEDRVADFEFQDESGIPDWERFEKLVERKKTRPERQKELNDEIHLMEQFKKHRLEYLGPLRRER